MSNSDVLDSQLSSIQSNSIESDSIESKNHHDNSTQSDEESKKKELSEERINFFRVINTFKSYGNYNKQKLNDKIKYFDTLPIHHKVGSFEF